MKTTRTGKIARLPQTLREQLNRRLANGETGRRLVQWLNSLPEVHALMAAYFNGHPIREQSLSEWRHGGYHDWLAHQEALELAHRLAALTPPCNSRPSPTNPQTLTTAQDLLPTSLDALALQLATRYAQLLRQLPTDTTPQNFRALHNLCADVVALRRADHGARRLQLDHQRFHSSRKQAITNADQRHHGACKGLPHDALTAK